jgi:hypothetical protein
MAGSINGSSHRVALGKILLTQFAQISCGGARSGASRANGEFAVLEFDARPTSVMGPLGPLTLEDLPSSSTGYWVSRRKAEVLAAIDGGLLSLDEACARYRLSLEEIAGWRRSLERAGIAGLRITKVQRYRHVIG